MKKEALPPGARNCSCAYLDRPRPRKQKGGTIIARYVRTLEQHQEALRKPDRVRPERCARCKVAGLHVHERRSRVLAGEVDGAPAIEILIFRCERRDECGAIWRMLPHFMARHLWRRWTIVGLVVAKQPRHRVPRRTQQRWRSRLSCAAAVLVALLGHGPSVDWRGVAARVGVDATRLELVQAAGGPSWLDEIACVVDRLTPGVRVM